MPVGSVDNALATRPTCGGANAALALSDPTCLRDKEADWFLFYDASRTATVRALLEKHPEIVEEHERNPLSRAGEQSQALQILLNFFRGHPTLGKFYVYAQRPWLDYRIATLTERGAPPTFIDQRSFPDENAAAHAVFVLRVESLGSLR
ncbi:hypothetical protein [Mycobacterium adipatum]|uniref:hypothetical protein n=1 Tax=Mycobacterium adipatum TaxID=1682113 RepID=UPI000AB16494|nr:hypothetical protein [Mycobacterium adipatum]